jgi:hypothetical protein
MFNVANVVQLFNELVKEKYLDCEEDKPSPQDHTAADQLSLGIAVADNFIRND